MTAYWLIISIEHTTFKVKINVTSVYLTSIYLSNTWHYLNGNASLHPVFIFVFILMSKTIVCLHPYRYVLLEVLRLHRHRSYSRCYADTHADLRWRAVWCPLNLCTSNTNSVSLWNLPYFNTKMLIYIQILSFKWRNLVKVHHKRVGCIRLNPCAFYIYEQ